MFFDDVTVGLRSTGREITFRKGRNGSLVKECT